MSQRPITIQKFYAACNIEFNQFARGGMPDQARKEFVNNPRRGVTKNLPKTKPQPRTTVQASQQNAPLSIGQLKKKNRSKVHWKKVKQAKKAQKLAATQKSTPFAPADVPKLLTQVDEVAKPTIPEASTKFDSEIFTDADLKAELAMDTEMSQKMEQITLKMCQ